MEAFLSPGFAAAQVVDRLGVPEQKTAHRWQLRPRDPKFSSIILSFEDLLAGKGLLTTIELHFASPWQVTMERLEQWWGKEHRWLPAPDRGRPRPLCFDRSGKQLKGVIMLQVSPQPPGQGDRAPLVIESVLLRRFFPEPPPKPGAGNLPKESKP
jgi:hypothetical protein